MRSSRGKNFRFPRAQLLLLFAKRSLKSVSHSPSILSGKSNVKIRVAKSAVLSLFGGGKKRYLIIWLLILEKIPREF